ncbi:hypothetical protein V502_09997, partial [Pseudogymnoascus sp. VKM F-4520 (FW-2644)]
MQRGCRSYTSRLYLMAHKKGNGVGTKLCEAEGQSDVVTFRWTLKWNLEEPGFTSSVAGTLNKVDDKVIERICKKVTEIMKIGGTPSCAVIVGRCGEKTHRMAFSAKEEPRLGVLEDHEMTYCIGSLSKILVATAAIILIDQTPGIEALKDAWDHTIFEHLGVQLRSDGPEPTISHLFSHTSGIPSVNDFLLGPDGTVMLSEDSFIHMVEEISQEGSHQNRCASTKAGAHMVSAAGHPRTIKDPSYFDDTIAFAAAGIYSCTNDLAIFFEALLSDEKTRRSL